MLTLHIAALIALITIPPMIMLERVCLLDFSSAYECENRVRCVAASIAVYDCRTFCSNIQVHLD